MPGLIRLQRTLWCKSAMWLPICFLFSGIGNIEVFNVGSTETTAQAKAANFESLTGAVTDPAGRPVAGASVNARSLDHPGNPVSEIGIITDAEGHYRWLLLPGRYSITVSRDGFRPVTQSTVIKMGEPANLNFVLKPGHP